MLHPTPTLQLRSIATCVHITTNTNMPHPKNNNPRGGGESAAYQKQQIWMANPEKRCEYLAMSGQQPCS